MVLFVRLLLLIFALLFMEVSSGRWVSKFAIPKASAVGREIAKQLSSEAFYVAILTTVSHAMVALLLSGVTGITVAWLMWRISSVRTMVSPYLMAAYSTPRIVFLPLFIVWIGFGDTTIVVYATIACFFIFVFNCLSGFDNAGRKTLDILRVLGMKQRQIFFVYLLPASRGYLVSAVLVAFPNAILAAIIGEMILGSGLGGWISFERGMVNVPGLYAATLVATVFATVINVAVQHMGKLARIRMGIE
jgi:NitT/TauT family transport system permease protein